MSPEDRSEARVLFVLLAHAPDEGATPSALALVASQRVDDVMRRLELIRRHRLATVKYPHSDRRLCVWVAYARASERGKAGSTFDLAFPAA